MCPERRPIIPFLDYLAYPAVSQLFPIYNELKDNSQARMNAVIGGSIGTATIVYEVIAMFGYLTFGSKVGIPYA